MDTLEPLKLAAKRYPTAKEFVIDVLTANTPSHEIVLKGIRLSPNQAKLRKMFVSTNGSATPITTAFLDAYPGSRTKLQLLARLRKFWAEYHNYSPAKLDKPEAGKVYSLTALASNGSWAESEVRS